NLYECVLAMESLCEEVNKSQMGLRNGTRDLPRMSRVLDNEKIFLLVDEETIRQYKSKPAVEIEPRIHELISRAEKGIKGLHKRLQAKVLSFLPPLRPLSPSHTSISYPPLTLAPSGRCQQQTTTRDVTGSSAG
ncbi:hypothetical protein JAAARDRAFT_132088, partial [Jaapia argillacea MUCL 33604]